jgi:hypothetical protein
MPCHLASVNLIAWKLRFQIGERFHRKETKMNFSLKTYAVLGSLACAAISGAQAYSASVQAIEDYNFFIFNDGGQGSTSASDEYQYLSTLATATASLSTGEVTAGVQFFGGPTTVAADATDLITIRGSGTATFTYASAYRIVDGISGYGSSDPSVTSQLTIYANSSKGKLLNDVSLIQKVGPAPAGYYGQLLTYSSVSGSNSVNYNTWQFTVSQTIPVQDGETISLSQSAFVANGDTPYVSGNIASLDPSWGLTLSGGATYTTASGIKLPAAVPEPSSYLALVSMAFAFRRRRPLRRIFASTRRAPSALRGESAG